MGIFSKKELTEEEKEAKAIKKAKAKAKWDAVKLPVIGGICAAGGAAVGAVTTAVVKNHKAKKATTPVTQEIPAPTVWDADTQANIDACAQLDFPNSDVEVKEF